MRLAVTGATSSIGHSVCDVASIAGHDTVRLVRQPRRDDRYFDLNSEIAPEILDGVDAVIHLAWQWSPPGMQYRQANVDGSRRLFDIAAARDIPVVLLSTFSVFTNRRSEYADCKRALEYDLRDGLGTSVRAGLIWGGEPAGMISTVMRMASTPFACLHLAPDPVLYQTELETLARLLVSIAAGDSRGATTWAAWPEPLLLAEISHAVRDGSVPLHVSVPIPAIRAVAKAAELARIPFPMRSDSLGGALRRGDVPRAPSDLSRFAGGFPSNDRFLSWLRDRAAAPPRPIGSG